MSDASHTTSYPHPSGDSREVTIAARPGVPPRPRRSGWRRLLGPGAVLLVLLARLEWILIALGKVKFLGAALSILVSIGAYMLIWGWSFAVGFVALIFVHEIGHVIQLRREGIPASAPYFIPFVGAVVMMKRMPPDAAAEARVGLAGPILGSVGCLVPLGLWMATGADLFQALTFVGLFINLFNLIPILPLDGGRAMAALSPWAWLGGLVLLAGLMVFWFNWILIIILLMGGFEVFNRFQDWRRAKPESLRFHQVSRRDRILIGATYLVLVVVLAVGAYLTYLPRAI